MAWKRISEDRFVYSYCHGKYNPDIYTATLTKVTECWEVRMYETGFPVSSPFTVSSIAKGKQAVRETFGV